MPKSLLHTPYSSLLTPMPSQLRSPQKPKIAAQSRENKTFPLSFAQQRLWFLQQLEPHSSSYHISGAIRLQGSLDVAVLEASLNQIVSRHESLRTNFIALDGEPLQVIKPELKLKIQSIDLKGDMAEIARIAENEPPFDLARDPLLRVSLLHLNPCDRILLFTMHHIISDGWSLDILVQELAQAYQANSDKQPLQLPELAIQYADFAVWQRQWLQGNVLETQLSYWKRQLENAPPLLELPSDRPRPRHQSFKGANRSTIIPASLTRSLIALSRQEKVTPFMLLLGAFNVLLHRYSQQTDICIGCPIANRNRVELEAIVGLFVNTLVLRADLNGDRSAQPPWGYRPFTEFLSQIRQTTLDAFAHQDIPFEKLVEELHLERNLSYNPLFQVMFQFQNLPDSDWELPDLQITNFELPEQTTQFDLSLNVVELPEEEGWAATLEYSTDLFDAATIDRFLDSFKTLLAAITVQPGARISELPVFPTLPPTIVPHLTPTGSILDLINEQVRQNPNATAVIFQSDRLTYRELDERSDRLAAYLQNLGVTAETSVGICLDRSLELVIGLLGILKSGGAYLPLDPTHPPERLTTILADAKATILLTQSHIADKLPNLSTKTIYLADNLIEAPAIASNSGQSSCTGAKLCAPTPYSSLLTPHSSLLTPHSLSYTIYTSGSTGKPKGVQISHASLFNLIKSFQDLPITPEDVLLSVTTISFDIAALEIFLPLSVGAAVEIASTEVTADAWLLAEKIEASRATLMQATPATWKMLLAAGWQGNSRLRVISGGEALSQELGDRLRSITAGVWNAYGPTETTIWSAIWQLNGDTVRIGRPIANTDLYILDRYLQRVPPGVIGELYIGGAGLARGYVDRPELTAQKFIPHPFSQIPGARLYQTGDLAKYLPNGEIECLGRSDRQVKVRGFRIELGEIEAVISQHPQVAESVAMVGEEGQIFVYFQVKEVESGDISGELRHLAKLYLPQYMMPSAFIELTAFPLTPNGKIDKKALPKVEAIAKNDPIAPRTPTEAAVTKIWLEVLNIAEASLKDNFFALGGHSLLATQAIARLRRHFNSEVPLYWLFEYPTIAQLASAIDGEMRRGGDGEMRRGEYTEISPCDRSILSFAQQRLWFLHRLAPDSSAYNLSSHVRLKGAIAPDILERSFQEVIRRHEVLRTSFIDIEGEPCQIIAPNLPWKLAIADLRMLPVTDRENEARALAKQCDGKPFDLTSPPLFRATLVLLEDRESVLLLTMHHIISDGWSMGVLLKELVEIYLSFSAGEPSSLPELPIQYADFAHSQRQQMQGENLEIHLNYWKQQLLGGNLPALKLPIQSTSATDLNAGASYTLELSAEVSQKLQQFSRQENLTLFMTLLAAFQLLLHQYSQQDDIVVGTDIANRTTPETELLIGFFVNLLVLRTDFRGKPSFRELLQRVRQIALEAYAHQDLPFDKLVAELCPDRSSDRHPLFQVLFVLQNTPMPEVDLDDLELHSFELEDETSKFDLALFATETAGALSVQWQYKTSLFEAKAIAQMAEKFSHLLNYILLYPDSPIDTPAMLPQPKTLTSPNFKNIKPKAVSLTPTRLVNFTPINPESNFFVVCTPTKSSINLIEWCRDNRELIEAKLQESGGILFRGFGLESVTDFQNLAQAICPELFAEYGDLPREAIANNVYGSTPYPADKPILFHNESSHMYCHPMKIWFHCVKAALSGGETPIADCRQVYKLLDPHLRAKFADKGLLYVRNYIEGLDVSWQTFFRTQDKSAVEAYCDRHAIQYVWHSQGLKTWEIRPAISQHPRTKEAVFFNQIFLHHTSRLDPEVRESLVSLLGFENLPRQVYYGDSEPIEDSIVSELLNIYNSASIQFPWQKGDTILLDNMLAAHGRNPFTGDRKTVVAMGELIGD